MAYATLTPQAVTRAGTTASFTAPSGTGAGNGIKFSDNGRRIVQVLNAGGSASTVTLNLAATVDGQPATGRTVTVGATTGNVFIGPFTSDYRQSDGSVTLDFSNVTSVTCAVLEV